MPKVRNAVIAANGGFLDESKVWRKELFQIQIINFNLVNVFFIFILLLMVVNTSVTFHGKHNIFWVTPNVWTEEYIYTYLQYQ